MPRMKLCFVLPSLGGGGAERAAAMVLRQLDPLRFEKTLYLFRREGVHFGELDDTVRIVSAASSSRRWRRIGELAAFLRRDRPDVVVSLLSPLTVLLASFLAGKRIAVMLNNQNPVCSALHDPDYFQGHGFRSTLWPSLLRTGYSRADLITVTSRGMGCELVRSFGIRPERLRVIYNPVDCARVAREAEEDIDNGPAEPAGAKVLVTAGRLAYQKNYPLLLAAVKLVAARIPVRLHILGTGAREGEVRRLIQEYGLERQVHLAGFQSNPWKYMRRADAFVLASRYEGFGNVVVEAMACGVPVVATRSDGTSEIIEHDVNGLLVDHHEPETLASAILRVIQNGEVSRRLVSQGRRRACDFSLQAVLRQYESAFEDLRAWKVPLRAANLFGGYVKNT